MELIKEASHQDIFNKAVDFKDISDEHITCKLKLADGIPIVTNGFELWVSSMIKMVSSLVVYYCHVLLDFWLYKDV